MYKSGIEINLFEKLEESEIRYAHWKSNYQLFFKSTSDSDIEYDLLVERKQITKPSTKN